MTTLPVRILLAAVSVPLITFAQGVAGPVAGYIPDGARSKLLPVLGIPGAGLLGTPVALDPSWSVIALSPSQDYLLAAGPQGALLVVTTGNKPAAHPVDRALPAPERAAISPTGSAAVLLSGGRLQVLTGLPDAPSASGVVDLSAAIGAISAWAVADDGSSVLLASGAGSSTTLYSVSAGGEFRWLAEMGQAVVGSFANRSHRAAIAGVASNELWVIEDVTGDFALRRVAGPEDGISGPAGVAFSDDNRLVLAAHSGGVAAVDLSASSVTEIRCGCTPTLLARMRGNSVFRLTEPSNQPVWLVEAGGATPQVWFVPPKPAVETNGGHRR